MATFFFPAALLFVNILAVPPAYHTYRNARFGYRIDYPAALTPRPEAGNGDGRRFGSADILAYFLRWLGAASPNIGVGSRQYHLAPFAARTGNISGREVEPVLVGGPQLHDLPQGGVIERQVQFGHIVLKLAVSFKKVRGRFFGFGRIQLRRYGRVVVKRRNRVEQAHKL